MSQIAEHLHWMVTLVTAISHCLTMRGGVRSRACPHAISATRPNMNVDERPLTEKDTLAWLLARPSIETTVSELSRQMGLEPNEGAQALASNGCKNLAPTTCAGSPKSRRALLASDVM
jgi:hypothetical protein